MFTAAGKSNYIFSFVYGKQVPLFQSAVLRPLFRFGNSVFTSHRSPSPLHQQE